MKYQNPLISQQPEIVDINSLEQSVFEYREKGFTRGLSTGLRNLDEYYTVRKKEWTLITGIPGSGKTELLDSFMLYLATVHGWKFGVFSAENLPYERHVGSLLEKTTGKTIRNIDEEEMGNVLDHLKEHFWFINPDESFYKLDRIIELADDLIQIRHIDAISIDPWNELDHTRPKGLSETEYISQCLTKIRRFVRLKDIHIFLITHPTKLFKNPKTGKYPVPTPYDCSGSAHWRNKADNCISIWWDYERPGETEIHVQKIRFKEIGKLGMVNLNYDRDTGRYSE